MSSLFQDLSTLYTQAHDLSLEEPIKDAMAPPETLAPAAVLIGVTDRPRPGVLLTHRPETMRKHPGQAAFPGGKLDPGEDAICAALRETHEELGINSDNINIIGATDRFNTRTGFAITPVLATLPADLPITPNPAEVASWFEPPLDYILDPANQVEKTVQWEGAMRTYFEIIWQGHRIWGVTAAIIVNLTRRFALAEQSAKPPGIHHA